MSRLICYSLLALFGTEVSAAERLFSLRSDFEVAIRAQSPDDGDLPTSISPPSNSVPSQGAEIYNPFSPPATPSPQDPFLTPSEQFQPGPPPVFGPTYGATGPQPYRMGWTPKYDWSFLPSSSTTPDQGVFTAVELDSEYVFNTPVSPDLVFTATPQLNYRSWNATSSFNRDLYRFGLNLQLATPAGYGPWGYQMAFNPSINTDFESSLANEAWNLDANFIGFYQVDPQLMAVLGVQYYDRVHNIVLPYVGVVYTPDDLWEFRLVFPQGRISRFFGNFWWGSHWLYLNWEYHVDSFQVNTPGNKENQLQYQDYRITFGMRSEHPGFTKYIEAGYVFGRKLDYKNTLPDFDVADGFILRGGIRF